MINQLYNLISLAIIIWNSSFSTISSFPDQGKWTFMANKENCHYFSAHSTLFANSVISVKIACDTDHRTSDPSIVNIGLVVRSTPCFEEYFGSESILNEYFRWYYQCPAWIFGDFGYESVTYMKTEELRLTCDHLINLNRIKSNKFIKAPVNYIYNQSCGANLERDQPICLSSSSFRQNLFVSENTHQIKNGYIINVPEDGIYLLIIFINFIDFESGQHSNITVDVNFQSNNGHYLSMVDYPLLTFYASMSILYLIFAVIWFALSFAFWKELLQIQFIIATIILFGMIEKAIFYGVYQSLNHSGILNQQIFFLAEIFSCLKRTLARVLLIMISLGFEIIRPCLGDNINKLIGFGISYFVLGIYESTVRIYKSKNFLVDATLYAGLPLAIVDTAIFWWIFNNLTHTIKTLRIRRNCFRLELFNHLINVLVFAVFASVIFIIWQMHKHKLTSCLDSWRYLWIDEAYWHVLFSLILLAIMILWRPTNNDQRYQFTSLLSSSNSLNDFIDNDLNQCAIENNLGEIKMRFQNNRNEYSKSSPNHLDSHIISAETDDNLKWIEENISTTLVDSSLPSLIDSDEELLAAKFEISKIQ